MSLSWIRPPGGEERDSSESRHQKQEIGRVTLQRRQQVLLDETTEISSGVVAYRRPPLIPAWHIHHFSQENVLTLCEARNVFSGSKQVRSAEKSLRNGTVPHKIVQSMASFSCCSESAVCGSGNAPDLAEMPLPE
jgi:hypothetical protein